MCGLPAAVENLYRDSGAGMRLSGLLLEARWGSLVLAGGQVLSDGVCRWS